MEESKTNTEEDEEEEFGMEEDEIEEYKEMLLQLGFFPDKVQISSLSMVAEDHASNPTSAKQLYTCIRDMLISESTHPARLLPLVYVVDSILKNARGQFVSLIEGDAKDWIPVVCETLVKGGRGEDKNKVHRVLKTWKEFRIFKEESVDAMMQALDNTNNTTTSTADATKETASTSTSPLEGISPPVREQMQDILDEMHQDVDELDKVSLERLAAINPKLLDQIKQAAMDTTAPASDSNASDMEPHTDGTTNTATTSSSQSREPLPIPEHRPQHLMDRSDEWAQVNASFSLQDDARDLVGDLQRLVREGTTALATTMATTPPTESINLHLTTEEGVRLLAATSVTAQHVTNMMQRLQDLQNPSKNNSTSSSKQQQQKNQAMASPYLLPPPSANPSSTHPHHGSSTDSSASAMLRRHVNPADFKTGALEDRNEWVVGQLYNQGLPYISSKDGRRFKTQMELSHHFDELFRRSQAEKTMEKTEERGWYLSITSWMGRLTMDPTTTGTSSTNPNTDTNENINNNSNNNNNNTTADTTDPMASTVLADELRSKCAICGISFNMFFDHEEGEWMYNNCQEMPVKMGGEEEKEDMLVHVTCVRALGSPEELTSDQVLHQ